jgi:hypothetical protein
MTNTEKKLRKAGIYSESTIVKSTRSVIVQVLDGEYCDSEATEKLVNKVIDALSTKAHSWGGFSAAGGHWYLEKDYDSEPLQAALRDQMGPAYYS